MKQDELKEKAVNLLIRFKKLEALPDKQESLASDFIDTLMEMAINEILDREDHLNSLRSDYDY